MNTNMQDVDPLNPYEYSYTNNEPIYPQVLQPSFNYGYNVKMEPPYNLQYPPLNPIQYNQLSLNIPPNITEQLNQVNDNQNNDSQNVEDTKEHIKLLPEKRKKPKGKTSSYWNKKVEDRNFPFYGCTICNVSFQTIQDLDHHVTVHKGRLTSYDIRLRNRLKRKQKRKEQKKLKKLGKQLKKEDKSLEIEIKPEDGYIGNEKASDVNNGDQNAQEPNVVPNNNDMPKENDKEVKDNDSNFNGKSIEQNTGDVAEDDPRLQKLFKCFACQKQFSLSYYLKLHVRSHTDEKPYTCAECGQSFITASKLGRHTKRIHLAIRYQCRICYRFFSRFEYLTRHFDKKHAEDKLEGEPYDFNAILPYLKELEEELKDKAEKEKKNEEQKPKTEEPWIEPKGEKKEDLKPILPVEPIKEEASLSPLMTQIMVEVTFDSEIKTEQTDEVEVFLPEASDVTDTGEMPRDLAEPGDGEPGNVPEPGDDQHSAVDNNDSDEDYFPSNTWAATPKIEPPSSPVVPKKKRKFPAKCELCSKSISSASYLRVHMRTHTGEKPFKCYVCNRGFITASKMHRHVLTHDGVSDGVKKEKVKVKKEKKDKEIKTEDGAETEAEDKDSIRKIKTKSKKGKKLLSVVKKEYKKRPHCCAYCSKRFLHLETLQVHLKSHEGEELVLKCNFCLEVMPNEDVRKEHEASHVGPRPYLCTLCGRTYTKRETMIYHRKSHKTEEGSADGRREFICDICSKTFNAQCKLQRHIVSHKVERFILKYECPVCAHMFNTKWHIQMHLTTHQKEGLIQKENWNAILAMTLQNARKIPKQGEQLNNVNTEMMPPDERSRVCNICGEVFQHFYYLEEHLKGHGSAITLEEESKNEEKKHICPICNKGFKLHYYLKLHSFTHTKEKPYICQQCGKGFITKGKLKRHMETHAGLKKFQCHICYKFFTRTSYLRIHIRTIHGTQDYNFKQLFPISESM